MAEKRDSEDHGAALLSLVTEGEGFQYAPPSWRAAMRLHAEALITDLDAERHAHDQTRNQLLACQLAKSMAEEALTAQIARAEKAEAERDEREFEEVQNIGRELAASLAREQARTKERDRARTDLIVMLEMLTDDDTEFWKVIEESRPGWRDAEIAKLRAALADEPEEVAK